VLHSALALPDQNAYIEQFNQRCPTEVLNAHLFESIAELRRSPMPGSASTPASGPTTASRRVPPHTSLPRPSTVSQFPGNCPLDEEA
jgi:hypothetical protein